MKLKDLTKVLNCAFHFDFITKIPCEQTKCWL